MNGWLIVLGSCVTALSRYLRNRTQFARPGRPIFVEIQRIQASHGSAKSVDELLVNITMSAASKRRRDAAHDDEKISTDVLLQISVKTSAALNSHRVFHLNA
jgi:hypothetical protein